MFNPYYYLSKDERAKLLRRKHSREDHVANLRSSLASLSESRSMRESVSQFDFAATLTSSEGATFPVAAASTMTPTKRAPAPHPGTPWEPWSELKLRVRDPTRDINMEEQYQSTYWKSSHKKRPMGPAEEPPSLRLPQPKYSDPGYNCRNDGFSYASYAYNLRVREKAKEVSQVPWRTSGERTERGRIEAEMAKHHGATLELPPLIAPSLKEDSVSWVGPRMATTFPRLGRYFQPELSTQGSLLMEGFQEAAHPHSALFGLQSRARELNKEIKFKDPVKQRIGFQSRVPPGGLFTTFEWQPL